MNALVKKEIRLLLPGFLLSVVLVFSFLFLEGEKWESLVQFNENRCWVAIASDLGNAVTLKNDGTLWRWDFSCARYTSSQDKVLKVNHVQIGIHSDWIAIAGFRDGIISLAADGSLWYWSLESVYYNRIAKMLNVPRKPQLLGNIFSTEKR